jgi:hypothetical protein
MRQETLTDGISRRYAAAAAAAASELLPQSHRFFALIF